MGILSREIPPRWKAGCWALLGAGMISAYILKNIASGIGWLVQEIDGLPPLAAALIEVVAVLLLAPLAVTILIYVWKDWRMVLGRFFSFWVKGFKISVIALILILPYLIGRQTSELLRESSIVQPSTPGWLLFLPWGIYLFLLPFWAWALLRRLPQTFLGRGLIDNSDLDRIEQDYGP